MRKTVAGEPIRGTSGEIVGYVYLVEDEEMRRWIEIDCEPASTLTAEGTLYLSKILRDWGNRAKLWNTTL